MKAYDPDSFHFLDDIYSGRVPIARVKTVALDPFSPEREKDLRSGGDSQPVTLRFVNRTEHEVRLYWLDDKGVRHAYEKIMPGDRISQNTFRSHGWLASGPDDKAIALFVATEKDGIAIIK